MRSYVTLCGFCVQILSLVDKLGVMCKGKLIFFGTLEEASVFFNAERAKRLIGDHGMVLPSLDLLTPIERLFVVSLNATKASLRDFYLQNKDGKNDDAEETYDFSEKFGDKKGGCAGEKGGEVRKKGGEVRKKGGGVSWYRAYLILVCQQMKIRCLERGFYQTVFWLFIVMSFMVGGVYYDCTNRLVELTSFPADVELPPRDYPSQNKTIFPAETLFYSGETPFYPRETPLFPGEYPFAAEQTFDPPGNSPWDPLFPLERRLGGIDYSPPMEMPEVVSQTLRYYFSALFRGLDGDGLMPWLDLIDMGINGENQGVIETQKILPFLKYLLDFEFLLDLSGCLKEEFELDKIYPPTFFGNFTSFDPFTSFNGLTSEGMGLFPDGVASFAFDMLHFLDYTFMKVDYTLARNCFGHTELPSTLRWLLAVQAVKPFPDKILKCLKFPPLPINSLGLNPAQTCLPPDQNTTFADRPLSPHDSRDSAKSVGELGRQKKGKRDIDVDWSTVTRQMPFKLRPMQLVGAVVQHSLDPEIRQVYWQELEDILLWIGEKTQEEICNASICYFARIFPRLLVGIVADVISSMWGTLNVTACLFVVSAVTGCWGFDSALSFSLIRMRMNRDSFNGHHSRVTFALARVTVDAFIQSVPVFLFTTIVYFLGNLGDAPHQYWRMCLTSVLISLSANGLTLMVSALCYSVAVGVLLSSAILTFCLLLSGFVLRNVAHTLWYQILSSASMFRFGYTAYILNYFDHEKWMGIFSPWMARTFFSGVTPDDLSYWQAIGGLLAQVVVYRAVAILAACNLHKMAYIKDQ